VTRVLGDVRAFAAGAKQSDDITVLAVRYAPTEITASTLPSS
jgi:serine phosphatase RsbU (regulator of sigma subunit)